MLVRDLHKLNEHVLIYKLTALLLLAIILNYMYMQGYSHSGNSQVVCSPLLLPMWFAVLCTLTEDDDL